MQFNIKANFLCEVDPRQTTKRTTFFSSAVLNNDTWTIFGDQR